MKNLTRRLEQIEQAVTTQKPNWTVERLQGFYNKLYAAYGQPDESPPTITETDVTNFSAKIAETVQKIYYEEILNNV